MVAPLGANCSTFDELCLRGLIFFIIVFLPSHVGAVALYTVLWAVVAKYRKWPISAPRRTKPLNRSQQKFVQLRPPRKPKFIRIGWVSRFPIWVKLSTGGVCFFPVFCSASAQPTPSARVPHIIYQSTRFQPRICHWGVSSIHLIPGELSPKNPSFSGRHWEFPA